MSAESRSLLPGWHQRPVRWKEAPSCLTLTPLGEALAAKKKEIEGGYPKPLNDTYLLEYALKPHRRSSCLPVRTDITTNIPLIDWKSVEVPWGRTDKWTVKQ